MIESPETLVGRPFDEDGVRAYLSCCGVAAEPCVREDGFYVSFYSAGLEVAVRSDDTIETVFVHNDTDEGYAPYAGPLPYGLSLEATREVVRSCLGEPLTVRAPIHIEGVGKKGHMDTFRRGSLRIDVDYAAEGHVRLITFDAWSSLEGHGKGKGEGR